MSLGFNESDDILTYPEGDSESGLGGEFTSAALDVLSLTHCVFALGNIARSHFSGARAVARLRSLIQDLDARVKKLEAKRPGDSPAMRDKLKSSHFKEAVLVASSESVLSSNEEHVKHFAAVLAGSLTPSQWHPSNDNVSDLIRDLSRLTDYDIESLQVLSLAFKGLLVQHLGSPNPFLFTNNNEALDREVSKRALDREDFDAACGRLVGFGLALEEPWPTTRTQPHSRCFRPTRRGVFLLECLEDSPS